MIIRVEHKARYTVISDGPLRDPRLSFRATGLLAYLLSLPDGTDISGRRLCLVKKEGRDATFSALKELEVAGYLARTRTQNPESGLWMTLCTIIEVSPGNPPPSPGNQDSENQDSVFQDLKALVPSVSTNYTDASQETLKTQTGKPTWALPDIPVAKGLAEFIRQELEGEAS